MSSPSPLRTGLALFAVVAGLFMGLLDLSIVTIVIPEIGRALNADFSELSWVVNSYVLFTAAAIIPAGKLGDAIGRKRVFAAGMIIFTSASLLCGLAPNAGALIAFRALQGLGGAGMVTLSLALISQMVPADKQSLGWSLWGAVGGLALAAGPSLGGVLTQFASWRWVFFVNAPLGAVALPLVISCVENRRSEATGSAAIDWLGLLTVIAGLATLSLGLLEGQQWGWASARIIALLASAGVLLGVFFLVESTTTEPMVPLRYFRNARFSAASVGWFGAMFAFISIFFFLPVYLEVVRQYSVLKASLALSPGPFMSFLIAPLAGVVSRRIGPGVVAAAGIAIITAGVFAMSRVDTSWTYPQLIMLAMFIGVGFGAAVPTLTELAMDALDRNDVGIGAGIFNTVRQVAAVVAISALGAALQERMVSSFGSILSRSTLVPVAIHPAVQSEFERRAAQRGGVDAGGLPPELAGEIHRLASLALVDGLQLVYVIAGGICVAGLAMAAVLLMRAATRPAGRPDAIPVATGATPSGSPERSG